MLSQSGSEALFPMSLTVNSIPGSIQRVPPSIPHPSKISTVTVNPTWMSSSPSPSTSTECSRASVFVFSRESRDALNETTSYCSVIWPLTSTYWVQMT